MALAETFCWHFDFSESHCEGSWLFQRPRGTTFASFHELCTLYFVMLSPIHRVESARARSQNVIRCNSMIFDIFWLSLLMPSACQHMPLLPIATHYSTTWRRCTSICWSELQRRHRHRYWCLPWLWSRWFTMNGFDPNRCLVPMGMVYTCLYMSIHVYTCLYMSIHVYTCLYYTTYITYISILYSVQSRIVDVWRLPHCWGQLNPGENRCSLQMSAGFLFQAWCDVIVADGNKFPPWLFKKMFLRQEMWKLQGHGFRSSRWFFSLFLCAAQIRCGKPRSGPRWTDSVFGFCRSSYRSYHMYNVQLYNYKLYNN